MHVFLRLAVSLTMLLGFGGVSLAAAQENGMAAGGCNAQLTGIYGTISYADDGAVTEKPEGNFKLWVCQGLYFTFDAGGAQEASEVFENSYQFDWFLSDLNFIAMNFSPLAEEYVAALDRKFTLYPHEDDLGNRPVHLLLRAADMRPAGVALKFADSNTLRFFYFESISSLSFSNGNSPG